MGTEYTEYTEGTCSDGVAILKNGIQMSVPEILDKLNKAEVIVEAILLYEEMSDNGTFDGENHPIVKLCQENDDLHKKIVQLKKAVECAELMQSAYTGAAHATFWFCGGLNIAENKAVVETVSEFEKALTELEKE